MQTPQGRSQMHSLEKILLWQNVEVKDTQDLAKLLNIPMYILSCLQDPLIIEHLLFNAFLIYFQMPMTAVISSRPAAAAPKIRSQRLPFVSFPAMFFLPAL